MKKIVTMSLMATGLIFAGDVQLGLVQANGMVGLVSATDHSKIQQGSVGVYGDSNVHGLAGMPVATMGSVNAMGIFVIADKNSSITQGSVEISNSDVEMNKLEANGIAGFVKAVDNSSIDQGKLRVVNVDDATVNTLLQVNAIGGGALATDGSKITQGSIGIGNVDKAVVIAAGANAMLGGVRAKDGSTVSQGSVNICGLTALEGCGVE